VQRKIRCYQRENELRNRCAGGKRCDHAAAQPFRLLRFLVDRREDLLVEKALGESRPG
jgi:hypothetical protein